MERAKTVIISNGSSADTNKNPKDKDKLKAILSKIGFGVAGATGGMGLYIALKRMNMQSSITDPVIITHDKAPEATQVTDDLTLRDAFAVAREEVGPGGYFKHHGKYYSTYTTEESSIMTDEQKTDFAASTNNIAIDAHRISASAIDIVTLDGGITDISAELLNDLQQPTDTEDDVVQLSDNTATQPDAENELASSHRSVLPSVSVEQVATHVSFSEPLDQMFAESEAGIAASRATASVTEPVTPIVASSGSTVEPLDQMFAESEAGIAASRATASVAEPVTPIVASPGSTVEPLDQMFAESEAGIAASHATAIAPTATLTEINPNVAEALDQMLLESEKAINQPQTDRIDHTIVAQSPHSGNFVEPLDELLNESTTSSTVNNKYTDDKLILLHEEWISGDNGERSHVLYYSNDDEMVIKVDQNGDGTLDATLTVTSDGIYHFQMSDGREIILSEQELEQIIGVPVGEDIEKHLDIHSFVDNNIHNVSGGSDTSVEHEFENQKNIDTGHLSHNIHTGPDHIINDFPDSTFDNMFHHDTNI